MDTCLTRRYKRILCTHLKDNRSFTISMRLFHSIHFLLFSYLYTPVDCVTIWLCESIFLSIKKENLWCPSKIWVTLQA